MIAELDDILTSNPNTVYYIIKSFQQYYLALWG